MLYRAAIALECGWGGVGVGALGAWRQLVTTIDATTSIAISNR
jgi:hypothetical protein